MNIAQKLRVDVFNRFSDWKLEFPKGFDLTKPRLHFLYPHTSNWDTLGAICVGMVSGMRVGIVVKDDWNLPIIGPVLRRLNVVFINRDKPDLEALKSELTSKGLSLASAPEGTRSRVNKLKKGFYFFARDLDLDIYPSLMDYKSKKLRVLPAVEIKDVDGKVKKISAVMKELRESIAPHYGTGKYPENESPIK